MPEILRHRFAPVSPMRHHPDNPSGVGKFDTPAGGLTPEQERQMHENEQVDRVFNHDAKIVLAGLMIVNPRLRTGWEVGGLLQQSQNEQIGWKVNRDAGKKYCDSSLIPGGFVQKELTPEGTVGYKMTEKGMELLPAIGHLLSFSEEHPEHAMQDFFSVSAGATTGEGAQRGRTPSLRLRLLRAILENEGLRDDQLRERIGVTSTAPLKPHLHDLSGHDIVSYEATHDGMLLEYHVSPETVIDPDQLPVVPDAEQLGKRVGFIASKLGEHFDTGMVLDQLTKLFPRYANLEQVRLRGRIDKALATFASEGIMSSTQGAGVTLTDVQRERIEKLTKIFDKLKEDDPEFVAEGVQKAREILEDPNRVARLMAKARDHSSNTDRLTQEELHEEILGALDFAEGEVGPDFVRDVMGPTRYSRKYIVDALRDMRKADLLHSRKVGRNTVYAKPAQQGTSQEEVSNPTSDRERVAAFSALGANASETARWMEVDPAYIQWHLDALEQARQQDPPSETSELAIAGRSEVQVYPGGAAFEDDVDLTATQTLAERVENAEDHVAQSKKKGK